MHASLRNHEHSYPPTPRSLSRVSPVASVYRTQQLRLQYEFPLLVLLRWLERLVVLPPHRLLTLPAHNIPHNMPAGGHVPFRGF